MGVDYSRIFAKVTLGSEAVLRVRGVVDNLELSLLVVIPVPPVNHAVGVSFFVAELAIVPGRKKKINGHSLSVTHTVSPSKKQIIITKAFKKGYNQK
jgi:hypothetical protein